MIEENDNIKIKDLKTFENYLEQHAQRGFEILVHSLNKNGNIFEWLKYEFLK